jgi:hypothetical protein
MYIAFLESHNLEKSANTGELLHKFLKHYTESFDPVTQAVFLGSGLRRAN